MKSKSEIKVELAAAVAAKKDATRARRAIKCIPMKERTAEQHTEMLRLWGEAGACKERVRGLQLAYAFVRGRPYWTQERHARRPLKKSLGYGWLASAAGVSVEVIQEWVEAPVSAEALVAFEEHLLRAREAKLARRTTRSNERKAA